ncbi:MAG: Ig-like domain-containing protein, partial [Thermoplasmatota archaeon]
MLRDAHQFSAARSGFAVFMIWIFVVASFSGFLMVKLPSEAVGLQVPAGSLSMNTRWTASDSPVELLGNISVPSGMVLTIDPGVTVSIPPSAWISVEGVIWAPGTISSPILFQRSHSTYQFDGINITNGGYGYLDHIVMSGSAGGVKTMMMGSRAYVYNSTLQGNSAGFRGMSGGYGWVVNCTFDAPRNVTASVGAEVHEGKWFFFRAFSDFTGDGVANVWVRINGEKYPTELDDWTIFETASTGVATGEDGYLPAIPVNQYKHMGSTSSVRVEVTMRWNYSTGGASWRNDIDNPGLFVGDNFKMEWSMDFTPPPQPINLRIGNRTGNSIEVLWDMVDPPSDLMWFLLDYKKSFEADFSFGIKPAENKRSAIVYPLDEETRYDFRIKAEDHYSNDMGYTGSVTGRTLDVTPPSPPPEMHVENLGGDWVELKWTRSPSNDVVGFWIYIWSKDGTFTTSQHVEDSFATSAVIPGLPSETKFAATIRPYDDAETPNFGANLTPLEFETLDITPPPSPRIELYKLEGTQMIPGSIYFNTTLVGFKVNVTGEDRTVIEILLDGKEFVDPDGIIERWTTYNGIFTYYFYLTEGSHEAEFRSIDPSGNEGPWNDTEIIVDLTPPEVMMDVEEGGTWTFNFTDTIELSVDADDDSGIHSIYWVLKSETQILKEMYGEDITMSLDVGEYVLDVRVYDIAGNWEIYTTTISVVVPDLDPPGMISISPEDGDVDVDLGPAIVIGFSESLKWSRLVPSLKTGNIEADLKSTIDEMNNTITYYPENDLAGNSTYIFKLSSIFDLSGNPGAAVEISFKTIPLEKIDTDKDGIPDGYEREREVLSPSDPDDAARDFDNDGLTNLQEYQIGSDPSLWD